MIRAAGGVVVRRRPGSPAEIVVVHRPAYDDWTLPKGKLLPREDEADAALREVEEETGLRCVLGPEIGRTEYQARAGPKVVHWWLMASPDDDLKPTDEIDEARWVALDGAPGLLGYDHDLELLQRAAELLQDQPEVMTVRLVRHVVAEAREQWEGPDELRPLTEDGWRQAEGLVELLLDREPVALVSSPFVRCVQSFEPLAKASGLRIQEHEALEEGAPVRRALDLVVASAALGPVVLCTHGDVQQGVIEALAGTGVPLTGPLRYEKGSVWEIDVRSGEPVGGRYSPPPS